MGWLALLGSLTQASRAGWPDALCSARFRHRPHQVPPRRASGEAPRARCGRPLRELAAMPARTRAPGRERRRSRASPALTQAVAVNDVTTSGLLRAGRSRKCIARGRRRSRAQRDHALGGCPWAMSLQARWIGVPPRRPSTRRSAPVQGPRLRPRAERLGFEACAVRRSGTILLGRAMVASQAGPIEGAADAARRFRGAVRAIGPQTGLTD